MLNSGIIGDDQVKSSLEAPPEAFFQSDGYRCIDKN